MDIKIRKKIEERRKTYKIEVLSKGYLVTDYNGEKTAIQSTGENGLWTDCEKDCQNILNCLIKSVANKLYFFHKNNNLHNGNIIGKQILIRIEDMNFTTDEEKRK